MPDNITQTTKGTHDMEPAQIDLFCAKYARQIAEAVIDLYKAGIEQGIDQIPDAACVVALAFREYEKKVRECGS